jgi:hypothetical protein
MTCRHQDRVNNPECSSYRTPAQQAAELEKQLNSLRLRNGLTDTPDAKRFEVEDVEEASGHLVMKVRYPNCAKCSYEGLKVLVFENVRMKDVIRWKTIDPHFRDASPKDWSEAPSPIARFPASDVGWKDALQFVDYRNRTGEKK